jgi:hypothetical protein
MFLNLKNPTKNFHVKLGDKMLASSNRSDCFILPIKVPVLLLEIFMAALIIFAL